MIIGRFFGIFTFRKLPKIQKCGQYGANSISKRSTNLMIFIFAKKLDSKLILLKYQEWEKQHKSLYFLFHPKECLLFYRENHIDIIEER